MTGKFHYLGHSSDRRTNAWRLTLPCGHDATPPTTMLASQLVSCPKCTKEFWINYNDQTMKALDQ